MILEFSLHSGYFIFSGFLLEPISSLYVFVEINLGRNCSILCLIFKAAMMLCSAARNMLKVCLPLGLLRFKVKETSHVLCFTI